jgi:hypothetical protein
MQPNQRTIANVLFSIALYIDLYSWLIIKTFYSQRRIFEEYLPTFQFYIHFLFDTADAVYDEASLLYSLFPYFILYFLLPFLSPFFLPIFSSFVCPFFLI